MTKVINNNVKVLGLGGLEEIGKNTYLVEYQDEIVIIDAGIKFPESDLLGIDYVIPDYTYLVQNKEKIKGLFITHGHEDHIGGIPFLLKELNVPIYAGKLAAALIKERLKEHGILNQAIIHEIDEDQVISYNHLSVEFFRTTHSIPDSYGVVVRTPYGHVVHTGDFKFDLTPIGTPANLSKISRIGDEGVLCLLSDSTNSEIPGFSLSENHISQTIHHLFTRITGRIIFATFASNMYRFKQAIEAALINNRKIAVLGRSLERAVRIGQELGYLDIPQEALISPHEISKFRDDQLMILCTGSQGEPFAALSRIANKRHPKLAIKDEDTVIFSSSPIPGNALSINKIIDQLSRAGATVIHHKLKDIHTSGHGAQEELKLMIHLLKPKFFVPIHGEYRMLSKHVQLANQCGVPLDNAYILENGQKLELNNVKGEVTSKVPARATYVDGEGVGDIGTIVLRDRRILSESGVLIVTVNIDMKNKKIISGPDIISRGFVFIRESEVLIKSIKELVNASILQSLANGNTKWADIKKGIFDVVEPFVYKETKRRPIILPIIMEVRS